MSTFLIGTSSVVIIALNVLGWDRVGVCQRSSLDRASNVVGVILTALKVFATGGVWTGERS